MTHVSQARLDIAAERARQREAEGYSLEHDDAHVGGELALAAACYARPGAGNDPVPPADWPWEASAWKPKTRRCDLVRAAALNDAEIERLLRLIARAADASAQLAPGGVPSVVEQNAALIEAVTQCAPEMTRLRGVNAKIVARIEAIDADARAQAIPSLSEAVACVDALKGEVAALTARLADLSRALPDIAARERAALAAQPQSRSSGLP